MTDDPRRASQVALAVALDAACVLLFVAVGRRNHDEDPGIGGTLETAAPFLIALVVGWLVVARAGGSPTSVRTGVGVWIATVAGGLLVRRTVFDRGTALAFVIVAIVVLGALVVGWRGIATLRSRWGRDALRCPPSP